MDKESVLQKRNRAEHSSLLIVSAGFLLLCTCEVFGIITGKLWIGQREIVSWHAPLLSYFLKLIHFP